MSQKPSVFLAAAVVAAALVSGRLSAKIESLTLPQINAKADDCVSGVIRSVEVVRIDHPTDGRELFYTHLRIEGVSLRDGQPADVVVTFAGGVLPSGEGVWNSEAPSADDTRVGNRVVAFYKWTDNMGGDLAANAIYAAHGGLYRVMSTRRGEIVLGRGAGYAIDDNRTLDELALELAQRR